MKNSFLIVFAIFWGAFFGSVAPAQNSADTNLDEKKFEVGGQFTVLRRSDPDTSEEVYRRTGFIKAEPLNQTDLGVGLRLGYNFTKNITVEAEANYFPENKKANTFATPTRAIAEFGGRKFQFVAGPKIGIRKKKFGVFGKIRPGLLQIERFNVISLLGEPVCIPNNGCPPSFILPRTRSKTFFNVDVGGVFEYYPTKRTILRFDVGDTIIRYNAQEPRDINPSFTRHSLQFSTGFGFRF